MKIWNQDIFIENIRKKNTSWTTKFLDQLKLNMMIIRRVLIAKILSLITYKKKKKIRLASKVYRPCLLLF